MIRDLKAKSFFHNNNKKFSLKRPNLGPNMWSRITLINQRLEKSKNLEISRKQKILQDKLLWNGRLKDVEIEQKAGEVVLKKRKRMGRMINRKMERMEVWPFREEDYYKIQMQMLKEQEERARQAAKDPNNPKNEVKNSLNKNQKIGKKLSQQVTRNVVTSHEGHTLGSFDVPELQIKIVDEDNLYEDDESGDRENEFLEVDESSRAQMMTLRHTPLSAKLIPAKKSAAEELGFYGLREEDIHGDG